MIFFILYSWLFKCVIVFFSQIFLRQSCITQTSIFLVFQEKLEKLKEKRRQKEEIIDRKQQEREKERLVIAREKAR